MENSQNRQLDELKSALQRHEGGMMEVFMKEGPEVLRSRLGVKSDHDWKLIFDYLVRQKNVLERCATDYISFFKDLVIKNGPAALKRIFKIEGNEYHLAFERLMDHVAVSHGAIYRHVMDNKHVFAGRIMNGESRMIRADLCITDKKYDSLWLEILELLQNAVCTRIMDERACEEGLVSFTKLINTLRDQRSLRSFAQVWAYND